MEDKAAARLQISKFDGKTNFHIWKVDVQDLLAQSGLKRTLLGDAGKPEKMEQGDWEDRCDKALGLIRLSLADDVKRGVLDETSPAKLWARLSAKYTGTSMLDRHHWKRKMFRLSMKEGTPLNHHISEFQEIASEMKAIGIDDVSEESQAFCLIYSLPASYDNLIMMMLHGRSAKESIKVEDVIRGLKEDALRKEAHSADGFTSSGQALMAERGQSGGRNREKPRCQHCRRRGHDKKDCWLLQGKKKEGEGNLVSESKAGPEEYCLLMAGSSTEPDWLLDSGSSSHICPHRQMFSTYRPISGKSVQTGTGGGCTVEGEGTVEIQMTGGRRVVLHNTLHIPQQKFGLISLGTLESQGWRYSARGGVLRVFSDRRQLFRGKRIPHQNLYRLSDQQKTWPGDKPLGREEVTPAPKQRRDPDDRTSSQGVQSPAVGGVRAEAGGTSATTSIPSVLPEHSRVC